VQRALKIGTIRGGAKATSKKKFTVYLRPVVREEADGAQKQMCFLWTSNRCPYGDECKFLHEGEGGCLEKKEKGASKKKRKCFDYKKGKCKLGDECPHSHNFEVAQKDTPKEKRADSEKDCINWKTKGKCRKGEKCPYRHFEAVREAVLAKKKKRKGPSNEDETESDKSRQPLSIRVDSITTRRNMISENSSKTVV